VGDPVQLIKEDGLTWPARSLSHLNLPKHSIPTKETEKI